jgi:hypothetical protein
VRLAFDDKVEVTGGETERAARVALEVPALAVASAGFKPEVGVDPRRTDAGDMRASIVVDCRQPTGVAVWTTRFGRLSYPLAESRYDDRPVDGGQLVEIGKIPGLHHSLTC